MSIGTNVAVTSGVKEGCGTGVSVGTGVAVNGWVWVTVRVGVLNGVKVREGVQVRVIVGDSDGEMMGRGVKVLTGLIVPSVGVKEAVCEGVGVTEGRIGSHALRMISPRQ
jgi:hypothetical protein